MRKERTLRQSMQTKIQQQSNSENTVKNTSEEVTNEQDESTSESDESIHHIREINKINEMSKHFTAVVQINGTKKDFIIDAGTPISIMPPDERIMKSTEMQKITNRYQDVNKNEVKVEGNSSKHRIRKKQTENVG